MVTGLHLFTSNRLETLADHLAYHLLPPLSSPLQSETIVVRNKGMERWLKQELARRQGICANAQFPFPEAFGQRIFQTLFPESPAQPGLERDALTWRIMGALPALIRHQSFAPLRHYLDGEKDERKLIQLATKIANLFDQYQVFRPNLITEWDAGAGTDWQAVLWRAVAGKFETTHASALWKRAGKILHGPALPEAAAFPERISIFGVSALTPFHLDLFAGLAQHIQVNLFLLQPSQEYWGDITSAREGETILRRQKVPGAEAFQEHLETGNRLLASMGYLGRDFLKLMLEAGDWISHEDFTEPGGKSLLHHIQGDLLHLHDRGKHHEAPRLDLASDDTSIAIHSCHGPAREMEVLYDQMLDWFQHDSTLAPRDIVVMTPEIETYAPYIQAVFGSPEDETRAIPFSVADRSARGQSQIIDTFLRVLDLPNTRFGAATVLGILEAPAVREQCGLVEEDLSLVRSWIEETNIRWGIDAAHRAELDLPRLEGNTWRHGLNRLLLGYSLAGGGENTFHGILPHDAIEGQSASVLGRFAAFVEKLIGTVRELERPRPLAEWTQIGFRVLQDFFGTPEDAAQELQIVREALNALTRQQTASGFEAPVSLAVLIERLRPVLEEDLYNAGFLTGGVTFCGLKPMRSIPFRIVCLVGMNDNSFPRPTHQLSFDLMAQRPRLGDRSTREDDRYLFLETILSARDRLYLSYVGLNNRDNSEAPPSVLISELLDYIGQGFHLPGADDNTPDTLKTIRDRLVTKHRLQAFSEEYFAESGPLFSYSTENCRASNSIRQARTPATAFLKGPLPETGPEVKEIALDDLIRCLMNPASYFLQCRLHISFPRGVTELAERESFLFEGLDRHAFQQKLAERWLRQLEPTHTLVAEAAAGKLPLGTVGAINAQQSCDIVESFVARVRATLGNSEPKPIAIDLRLGEHRLTGTIPRCSDQGPLLYRCATLKATDQLRAWITHLAAVVTRTSATTTLVGRDETLQFRTPANPAGILEGILGIFLRNHAAPVRLFPASALAFAQAEQKLTGNRGRRSPGQPPLEKAREAWNGNSFLKRLGEKDDPAFAQCFREPDPLNASFMETAREVFGPLIEHRTELTG